HAPDDGRHVEVFNLAALLTGGEMAASSASGGESLATRVTEPDFSLASFLLPVLGEGSSLILLTFLRRNAPVQITRQLTRPTRRPGRLGSAAVDRPRRFSESPAGVATAGGTWRTRPATAWLRIESEGVCDDRNDRRCDPR